MLDPSASDAAERTRRAIGELGLRGLCLFPAMHHVPLSDSRVQEVVEIVAAHPGTAVFVHCGVLSVGVRRKLGLPSKFDLRLGDPLGVARLALAYPNLPFIIPHFGAGMFREALMAADTCANIHLDTSSSNSWIRYTPGLTLEAVFRTAVAVAGARRLLFGTDSSFFPRGWQRGRLRRPEDRHCRDRRWYGRRRRLSLRRAISIGYFPSNSQRPTSNAQPLPTTDRQ